MYPPEPTAVAPTAADAVAPAAGQVAAGLATAVTPDAVARATARPAPAIRVNRARATNPTAAVLFDLDGTLLDTAPDMGAALNRLLDHHGRAPLPATAIRPHVSSGTRGMLLVGFGLHPDQPGYAALREEYLALYAADLCRDTVPFGGVGDLLTALAARGIPWGIVTNKPGWLTDPLLAALTLPNAPACVVSGDTAARPKPHPDPLLHATEVIGCDAGGCWYVGDHQRDIQAGVAAGMATLAALYGYLGIDTPPEHWGADGLITHPLEVLDWIAA